MIMAINKFLPFPLNAVDGTSQSRCDGKFERTTLEVCREIDRVGKVRWLHRYLPLADAKARNGEAEGE